MALYAQVQDGIVITLLDIPPEYTIDQCFPPDIAETYKPVPDGVTPQQGWTAVLEDDVWVYAAPVPPPLTWDQELAVRTAQGIIVHSATTSALDGTYMLYDPTMNATRIAAQDSLTRLGLPGGKTTFDLADSSDVMHTFTATDIQNLYIAMRDLLFALTSQASVMKGGGTPTWPSQTVNIA